VHGLGECIDVGIVTVETHRRLGARRRKWQGKKGRNQACGSDQTESKNLGFQDIPPSSSTEFSEYPRFMMPGSISEPRSSSPFIRGFPAFSHIFWGGPHAYPIRWVDLSLAKQNAERATGPLREDSPVPVLARRRLDPPHGFRTPPSPCSTRCIGPPPAARRTERSCPTGVPSPDGTARSPARDRSPGSDAG